MEGTEQFVGFYNRHGRFTVALAYFVIAVAAAAYMSQIYFLKDFSQDFRNAEAYLKREIQANQELLDQLKNRDSDLKDSDDIQIKSLPDFLKRINHIASDTEVIIHKLMPAKDNTLRFDLVLIEDYYDFIRFSSKLESLDVSLHDIQVHPYNPNERPPVHAITFSLTPRADAEPLANERLEQLHEWVAEKEKRNPFQRFAYDKKKKQVQQMIDLTWIHRLTGIGRVGDARYATIDGRDYTAGDELSGMKITSIESRRVLLSRKTRDGTETYQLKFRPLKKK